MSAARVGFIVVGLCLAGSSLLAGDTAVEEYEEAEAEEPSAPAVELHGVADVRFAATSRARGWLDGGFGRTRFGGADSNNDGRGDRGGAAFHLGQLSLLVEARAGDSIKAHVHGNFDAEQNRGHALGRFGLVEGFVSWTTVLGDRFRLRVRGGVTIPPFSLEHPDTAWSTRYTITPSAIATWLGEEVKSTGLETTLLAQIGDSSELQLQLAAFTGNDSTGALLAWRGWALHDRQGQLGDELPLPAILSLEDPRFFPNQGRSTQPFREIDGRPGYHAQLRARLGPHLMLQGGWYDNRGDLNSVEPRGYTWKTRFALAGLQLDFGPLTVLGQFVDGKSDMGFASPALVRAPFRAGHLLASVRAGSGSRFTLRADRFEVADDDVWGPGLDLNEEDGWAAAAAFLQDLGGHHRLEVEYLHVRSDHPFAVTAGEPAERDDRQFQAGYRFSF